MIRLALAVLAGATIVAAQVTPDGFNEKAGPDSAKHSGFTGTHGAGEFVKDSAMKPPMDMAKDSAFQKKLGDAWQKCGDRADSARTSSHALRNELRNKSGSDSAKVMGTRDSTKRERIQGAIDAMERNSARMATQVKESQVQTQIRMTERRDELIQLQQRIREKKAEQAAAKEEAAAE